MCAVQGRCGQATASTERCVQDKAMWAGHGRRRLSDVCKTRAMWAGHGRRRLSDVCNTRAMWAGQGRCGQATADVD
ncbi:hypothetical protein KY290_015785 [Solanum tuberosum]|uniref:Uncharacterized protein n=1 Tax=Solanum tuberosum TaxID=4113 RepID=A0ABQ7VK05_SOLTU|nr:hypothetical protein KY284_025194 [Solanum tuberosum]KAH0674134.1 hypothetical protein KY284_025221 [Solanum tuberosum]KAH0695655.1 hypothetical protein KY289_013137 [Solanum tuberosum]KAH0695697.1 hypothetical protein KY289_013179 [Solanum tuberosum]KAH0695701.1 hypothetical protein KY289_013183 [Solanum tuberosum]